MYKNPSKYRQLLFSILIVINFQNLYADNSNHKLITSDQYTQKAIELVANGQTEQAKNEITNGIELAKKEKNDHNEAILKYLLADCYYYENDFKSAIELYTEIAESFEYLKDTVYWLRSLNSIGIIHNFEENNSQSLSFLTQGIEIANQVIHPCYDILHQKLMLLTNIINVYNRTNDFEKSIKLSNEAIEIALEINDSTRLGNLYNALGISYRNLDQTKKAIEYYEEAGKIFNQLNDHFTYTIILNNIASLYEQNQNIDSAFYYYTIANMGFKDEEYPFGIAKTEYGLAAIHTLKNNTLKAQQHFENAIKTASEYNYNDILIDALFDFSEFEYNNQNFQNAYQLINQYITLYDSIYSIEKEREIANLKSKYELSIVESELNNLKSESLKQSYNISMKVRQFQIALIFIVFLIAIAATVFIFYRQKNKANKLLAIKNIQIEKQNNKLIKINAEIEKANKKLQQSRHELMLSNQLKNRFFSVLAHDLQNPFHHVIGFSNLLSDYYDRLSDEERRNMATEIHQSTKNINQLLDNLLEWNRAQTGDLSFKLENVNVNQLIENCFTLLSTSAKAKSIELIKTFSDDIEIKADSKMLETVFRNLINNSIKFTHQGGKIIIDAYSNEQNFYAKIEDNGVGIDPKHLKNLFRIDSKYKTNGTANEKGTGLGLNICYEFIKYHKGKIWAESTPGKGSVFYFSIPKS